MTEYAGGGNTGYAEIGQEYHEGGRTLSPSGHITGGKKGTRLSDEQIAANKASYEKKKKAKANNIAAIDKPKVRKELKQVDPRGKSSKKAKKYFEDDSSGRA